MLKISLSFKPSERELYDFLKKKRSMSSYLKDLIYEDMKKEDKVNG